MLCKEDDRATEEEGAMRDILYVRILQAFDLMSCPIHSFKVVESYMMQDSISNRLIPFYLRICWGSLLVSLSSYYGGQGAPKLRTAPDEPLLIALVNTMSN